MILHYKLVKLWGQQADIEAAELDVIYNQLHRKYAPRTLALILKLRGFYVKIGQVVSVMDVVPELYRKELSVLQNGVPPKPPHEVHAMIAEQLGKSVGELFATFDTDVRVRLERPTPAWL